MRNSIGLVVTALTVVLTAGFGAEQPVKPKDDAVAAEAPGLELKLVSTPGGAWVFLNGRCRGKTPAVIVMKKNLTPDVAVFLPGKLLAEKRIDLKKVGEWRVALKDDERAPDCFYPIEKDTRLADLKDYIDKIRDLRTRIERDKIETLFELFGQPHHVAMSVLGKPADEKDDLLDYRGLQFTLDAGKNIAEIVCVMRGSGERYTGQLLDFDFGREGDSAGSYTDARARTDGAAGQRSSERRRYGNLDKLKTALQLEVTNSAHDRDGALVRIMKSRLPRLAGYGFRLFDNLASDPSARTQKFVIHK